MKKILFLMLLMTSCNEINEEGDKIPASHINHFIYDGHEYINFNWGSGYCIVNDPDCNCK